MNKKKTWLIAGVILLVGIGATVALVLLQPAPPEQPPPPQTPLVQTAEAEVRGGALTVDASGTVRPRSEVALAPQVGGRVVYVNPALVSGGRVREGEILVRLDPSDYQNQVAQARAAVAQEEVGVAQAEEEASIARAEYAQFERRQDALGTTPYAGVDPDDYAATLLDSAAVRGAADFAQTVRKGANSAAADTAGPSPLALRQPQLDAAEAALDRAQAQLDDAQLALSRTVVTAPFTGIVRSEQVDRGSYVAPGQTLAQLYESGAFEVVVPLSLDQAALVPQLWTLDAGRMNRRIPADVFGDYGAFRYRWQGFVERAENALDAESRTLDVVVVVPRPLDGATRVETAEADRADGPAIEPVEQPPLLVRQFVDIRVEGAALDRYVALPRRALRRNDEVYAIERDSVLTIVPVDVLQQVDEEVLVRADLDAGQPVVTSDLETATEGMIVRLASRVRQDTTRPDTTARSPGSSATARR